VSYNSCTIFYFYQQCVGVSVWVLPYQHLSFLLLNMAILTRVTRRLSVVLVHICFILWEVEYFFMYLVVIYTSSLKIPYAIHVPNFSLAC
jgi:hypothetical protein